MGRPLRRYDYAAQVARLHTFLEDRGVERAQLAGSSMGGTLAALYALEHPTRVVSVAFVGGAARDPLVAGERGRRHDRARRAPPDRAQPRSSRLDRLFEQRPFLPWPVYAVARERAIRDADSNERIWREQLQDRYLLHERLPSLDALARPVGPARPHLRRLGPRGAARAPPGLGHLPTMEDPSGTAARLEAFLARSSPSAGR